MVVVVPRRPGRRTLSSGWASPSRHHCPHHRPGYCFLPSNLVPVAIALAAVANARFVAHHPRPPLSPSPSPSPSSSPSPSLARHHCRCRHSSCRRRHSLFITRHHHHRHHRPCHPHPCPLRRPPASSPITLAAKAITLFVALHPRRQRHHPLHPPRPLRHPPPLSPSASPCRPRPFRHMLPSLVDCFFFTIIVGWAVIANR